MSDREPPVVEAGSRFGCILHWLMPHHGQLLSKAWNAPRRRGFMRGYALRARLIGTD